MAGVVSHRGAPDPGRALRAAANATIISDQVPEGAGADILAPNEPEPIEPLLVI